MKFRDDIYLGIALIVSAIATYFAIFVAPAEVELGELVRVLYFHLPPALLTYLSMGTSMVAAILFLWKKAETYDAVSESAALMGLVYGAVTLIGGAIWANATWGVYWNWDPRETTTLIAWLAYLGYFLLRMSVENPERRASVSAAFNVLAFMTVPLSYLSFIIWPSLHPRLGSEEGGIGLSGQMVQALLMNLLAGLLTFFWFIRKVYGVRLKRDELDRLTSEEMRIGG